jgi:alanine racemase
MRPMQAEAIRSATEIAAGWDGRPVVAVTDLDVVAGNVQAIKSLIGPDCQLMSVVKANAYGFAAVPIAKAAVAAGAGSLAVATVDEGIQLRQAGMSEVPILVFGAIGIHERARAITNRLSIVVTNPDFARGLATVAKESLWKEPIPVHLKIDTGMRRFGAAVDEVVNLAQVITSLPELRWSGIMTHHASADAPDPSFTHEQAAVFDQCLADLRAAGFTELPTQHVANTATTIRFPEYHRDMVRCGIATHGLESDPGMPLPVPFQPTTTIYGKVARVFDINPGDVVGYGGTYSPSEPERGALVPIGYADGYRRSLSNAGYMAIRGQRADVIGRVSMDQCVVRVPAGLDIEAGEPVVIVGDGTDATPGAPTINELAVLAGGIAHDFIVGLAHRLPRLFVQNGQVVAIHDLAGYRELS